MILKLIFFHVKMNDKIANTKLLYMYIQRQLSIECLFLDVVSLKTHQGCTDKLNTVTKNNMPEILSRKIFFINE